MSNNNLIPFDVNLSTIVKRVGEYQNRINESYLEIGRLLARAKYRFSKCSDWHAWVQENLDITISKAQRLVRVAEWIDGNQITIPRLNFTKAFILSRLTDGELDHFRSINDIENIPSDKLTIKVRNYINMHRQYRDASVTEEPEESIVPEANLAYQRKRMSMIFDGQRYAMILVSRLMINLYDGGFKICGDAKDFAKYPFSDGFFEGLDDIYIKASSMRTLISNEDRKRDIYILINYLRNKGALIPPNSIYRHGSYYDEFSKQFYFYHIRIDKL